MIHLTFRNINKLFVLSFQIRVNDPTRRSSGEYYNPLVEIKDFDALIDNKLFFDQSVKNNQEVYERLVKKL